MRETHQPDGNYHDVFGPHPRPVAHGAPGETVVVHTVDAFVDGLTSEDQKPPEVLGPYLNPPTVPLFIDGVEAGDTLVHIDKIEASRDWAASALVPFFGGLTSTAGRLPCNRHW